jgi:hypothetical protein
MVRGDGSASRVLCHQLQTSWRRLDKARAPADSRATTGQTSLVKLPFTNNTTRVNVARQTMQSRPLSQETSEPFISSLRLSDTLMAARA